MLAAGNPRSDRDMQPTSNWCTLHPQTLACQLAQELQPIAVGPFCYGLQFVVNVNTLELSLIIIK